MKKVILIIGLILVVLVAAFYLKRAQKDAQQLNTIELKKSENIQPNISDAGSVQETASPAESKEPVFSNWKKYESSLNDFDLFYPSDWTIIKEKGEIYTPVSGDIRLELSKIICCKYSLDEGMSLKIFYTEDKSRYPAIQKMISDKKKTYPAENFDVGPYQAVRFEGLHIQSKKDTDNVYMEEAILFLKTDRGFYTIVWNSMDPNKKGFTAQAFLKKILATFSIKK